MTIDEIIAELTRIDAELRALVAPLSDAQGNWQPDGGRRWSVRQIVQHLAVTNELYLSAVRTGLPGARKLEGAADVSISLSPWGRWYVRMTEPPPRVKVPAPRRIRPRSDGSLKEALDAFLKSQDAARAIARQAAGCDLRATFPNPFVGWLRVRIATGLLVVPAHDRRHLWQMRQVVGAPGFPAA